MPDTPKPGVRVIDYTPEQFFAWLGKPKQQALPKEQREELLSAYLGMRRERAQADESLPDNPDTLNNVLCTMLSEKHAYIGNMEGTFYLMGKLPQPLKDTLIARTDFFARQKEDAADAVDWNPSHDALEFRPGREQEFAQKFGVEVVGEAKPLTAAEANAIQKERDERFGELGGVWLL